MHCKAESHTAEGHFDMIMKTLTHQEALILKGVEQQNEYSKAIQNTLIQQQASLDSI